MRAALLVACCAACSLGGKQPHYQYYVLSSSRPEPAAAGSTSRTLGIDRVSIPGYLDREQVASRAGDQHLAYSATDRWAEPLDQAFERTLREDLTPLLATGGIQVESRGGTPTYDVSVDVMRFERTGLDRVELRAHWIVRADGETVDSGDTRVDLAMRGTDTNAAAAALSDAIARMAHEISDRVQRADAVVAERTRR